MSEDEDVQGVEEEEEDPVDAQEVLKEKCGETKKCSSLKDTLDACNERVSNKPTTAEICTQEVVDFMHCVDHCVAKSLFKHLK